MKYQFIKGEYKEPNQIVLYVRSENDKRRKIVVEDFFPYFYIAESDNCYDYRIKERESGFETIFGKNVKKISVRDYATIKRLRKHVDQTWEGKLDPVQRFLIDKDITSGLELPATTIQQENSLLTVSIEDINATDYTHDPVVCYLDIELFKKQDESISVEHTRSPIVAVSLGTNQSEAITTFYLSHSKSDVEEGNEKVYGFNKESDLLQAVQKYLTDLRPDLITGWDLRDFDLPYLENRTEKLGYPFDYSFSLVFDMKRGWRRLGRGASPFLKDIVVQQEIADWDDIIVKRYRTKLYKEQPTQLLRYSRNHINYLEELDTLQGVTNFYWDLKNRVGLTDMETSFYNGEMINLLLLREVNGNVVLPSKPSHKERRKRDRIDEQLSIEGGKVFEPEVGIYEHIAVLDFIRFYPSLVIANNISPELLEGHEIYEDGKGVMPKITEELWKERDRYEQKLAALPVTSDQYEIVKNKRNVVKFLLNSTWAYMGWTGSRIWNIEARKTVLETAREMLEYIAQQSENLGYQVVYGDTDSIFITTSSLEDAKHATEQLNMKALNIDLQGRVVLDLDKYFSKVLFTPHKQKQRAAQKRYIGKTTYREGKQVESIDIAGFSRSDNALLTERIRPKLCKKLFEEGKKAAINYLQTILKKIKQQTIPIYELAVPQTIHKQPDNYVHTTPWVRGIKYSNTHFNTMITKGDYVKTLYVARVHGYPPTREVSYIDLSQIPKENLVLDTKRIIEKIVKMKVEDILKLADIDWLQIEGYKKLSPSLTS